MDKERITVTFDECIQTLRGNVCRCYFCLEFIKKGFNFGQIQAIVRTPKKFETICLGNRERKTGSKLKGDQNQANRKCTHPFK